MFSFPIETYFLHFFVFLFIINFNRKISKCDVQSHLYIIVAPLLGYIASHRKVNKRTSKRPSVCEL